MNSKLLVSALLCAALSACNGGGPTVAKSALVRGTSGSHAGTPPGPGTNPVAPPSPTPTQLDTFAQSLETFSFAFNQTSRKVSVAFSRFAPEVTDSAGMPTIESTQEFAGEIPRGGASAKLVPRVAGRSDYSVRVDCADEACRASTITIDRLRGTLAGRVVLKREAREMKAQMNRNLPGGKFTTSRDTLTAALAELNNRANLAPAITASVTRVEDGRHDWFELRYDYADKAVAISGDLGPRQLVRVSRTVSDRDQSVSTSAAVFAKVRFRERPFAVSVAFDHSELKNPSVTVSQSMGDPLSW